MEVVDSVIIRGQQDFEKLDQLYPNEVKIDDGTVINILKNTKKQLIDLYILVYYSLVV